MIASTVIKRVLIIIFLAVGFVAITPSASSFAEEKPASGDSSTTSTKKCGGVETSIITCTQTGDGGDAKNSGLWGLLMIVVNILTAGVGVLALGGIVYGSILYTSAGGNTDQVKKAIGIFTNVGIGVIAFAGMWALLNFLVPGGVFNSL